MDPCLHPHLTVYREARVNPILLPPERRRTVLMFQQTYCPDCHLSGIRYYVPAAPAAPFNDY